VARLPFSLSLKTQSYGPRDNVPADPNHKGVDFGVIAGTAVPCASAGTVIAVGQNGSINYFKEVDHGLDGQGRRWTTRYHMLGTANGPQIGDSVAEGQIIGYSGPKYGVSTGAHHHFEVHNKSLNVANYGSAVDPEKNIQNVPSNGTPYQDLGDDMIRIQSANRGIALIGPGYFRQLTNNDQVGASADVISKHLTGNDAQFDLWRDLALNGNSSKPVA